MRIWCRKGGEPNSDEAGRRQLMLAPLREVIQAAGLLQRQKIQADPTRWVVHLEHGLNQAAQQFLHDTLDQVRQWQQQQPQQHALPEELLAFLEQQRNAVGQMGAALAEVVTVIRNHERGLRDEIPRVFNAVEARLVRVEGATRVATDDLDRLRAENGQLHKRVDELTARSSHAWEQATSGIKDLRVDCQEWVEMQRKTASETKKKVEEATQFKKEFAAAVNHAVSVVRDEFMSKLESISCNVERTQVQDSEQWRAGIVQELSQIIEDNQYELKRILEEYQSSSLPQGGGEF